MSKPRQNCPFPYCPHDDVVNHRFSSPLQGAHSFTLTQYSETHPVCRACEGAGWVGKLYPTGHHEVTCESCDGVGYLPIEEEAAPQELRCTCGAEKCNSNVHSSWCDKLQMRAG